MSLYRMIVLLTCYTACVGLAAGDVKIAGWLPYNKIGQILVQPDGSVKAVQAEKIGGVTKTVMVEPGRMHKFTVQLRGDCNVQVAIHGTSGFAYSPKAELNNEEWKTVSVTYFQDKNSLSVTIYSLNANASNFELKDAVFATLPAPELSATEIAPTVFEAENYPDKQGRSVARDGASGGNAVWGGNWYRVVTLPTPATASPVYFHVRAWLNGKGKASVGVIRDQQTLKRGDITEPESWQWVKIGPLNCAAMGENVSLNLTCEAGAKIFIDKIVLATRPDLTENELDKVE